MTFEFMALFNIPVVVLALLVFALSSVAIKSARSKLARLTISALATAIFSIAILGPLQLLSYPKPNTFEWISRSVPEAKVVYAELREGTGIYLLLDWQGESRWYVLEWNLELAQQLMEAMQEANEGEGEGQQGQGMTPGEGTVLMRDPFKSKSNVSGEREGRDPNESSADGNYDPQESESDLVFYVPPMQSFEPKEIPADPHSLIDDNDLPEAEIQNYQLPQEQQPPYVYQDFPEGDGF